MRLQLLHESPDFGNGRGKPATRERVDAHFGGGSLLVASQFSDGALVGITEKLQTEVQVDGRVGLGNYLHQVISVCKNQRRSLDLVQHSTLSTGIQDYDGVEISRMGLELEENRIVLEALYDAIGAHAIASIRLLGCVTGVGAGALNVAELEAKLQIPVVGTRMTIDDTHFSEYGLREDADVFATTNSHGAGFGPAGIRNAATVAGASVLQAEFISHLWSGIPCHWLGDGVAQEVDALVAETLVGKSELEKPTCVVAYSDGRQLRSPGYHIEILHDYARLRYYRYDAGRIVEHVAAVRDQAALKAIVARTSRMERHHWIDRIR